MRVFIAIVLVTISLSQSIAQTETNKGPSPGYRGSVVNPPGYRMQKIGKGLTIGGGVLLVGGIILASQADAYYYSSTSSTYGNQEEGDPKGALGVLMIVGGTGMIVPGIILWSKGAKKYKAYQQRTVSLGVGNRGIGISYNF